MSPGLPSTAGVQSVRRFSGVDYNAQNHVEVGAGLISDDMYTVLDPLGVGLAGGRATGVRNRSSSLWNDSRVIHLHFRWREVDSPLQMP